MRRDDANGRPTRERPAAGGHHDTAASITEQVRRRRTAERLLIGRQAHQAMPLTDVYTRPRGLNAIPAGPDCCPDGCRPYLPRWAIPGFGGRPCNGGKP